MLNSKLKFPTQRQKVSAFSLQPSAFARSGFTLVELLVVLSIMAIIAALAVPAFKNFGHADAMTAADQQVLNDVARARQLAISQRTTVYMVFVPTNFWTYPGYFPGTMTPAQKIAATNLCGFQLTGYTFVSLRAIGDQPGHGTTNYLAPWQALPDGTFFAQQKFSLPGSQPFYVRAYNPAVPMYGFDTNAFPFPTPNSRSLLLPFIAFNYLGQLTTNGVDMAEAHEYILLARGSVLPAMDPNTRTFQLNPPQVAEVPPGNSTNAYNLIDIDPLTGRATLREPKVQ